jgi:hypothetical protein
MAEGLAVWKDDTGFGSLSTINSVQTKASRCTT